MQVRDDVETRKGYGRGDPEPLGQAGVRTARDHVGLVRFLDPRVGAIAEVLPGLGR